MKNWIQKFNSTVKGILNSKSLSNKNNIFLISLNKLLQQSSKNKIVAIHGPCPDGTVSGVLLRFLFPEALFFPVDYWIIKHPLLEDVINNFPWFAVADLRPLSSHHVKKLYVDHHRSSLGDVFNAEQVFFDANGESASAVLYDALRSRVDFPDYFKELVDLTRITDTGSHPINPPLEEARSVEASSFGEVVWLFDDAVSSVRTVFELHELIDGFYFKGVNFLDDRRVQKRVNEMRRERREAWLLGQELDIGFSDFVGFVVRDEQLDNRSLLRSLLTRVRVGAVSVVEEPDGGARLSFRIRKDFQNENPDWTKYRVDLVAEELNGGGHMGAAGAKAKSVEEALRTIEKWCKNIGLKSLFIDLRKNKK